MNLLVGTDNGLLLLDRSGHGKGEAGLGVLCVGRGATDNGLLLLDRSGHGKGEAGLGALCVCVGGGATNNDYGWMQITSVKCEGGLRVVCGYWGGGGAWTGTRVQAGRTMGSVCTIYIQSFLIHGGWYTPQKP